jgi:methyl-accepting chemotaxis protein
MLSAMGASAKLHVNWNKEEMRLMPAHAVPLNLPANTPPVNLDLLEWIQQTVWGRDQFVKVAEMGYVMPFGHPVSFIKIHQREFAAATDANGFTGADTAILRERFYCEVLQDEIVYLHPADGDPTVGRSNCFRRVKLEPRVTPYLKRPQKPEWSWMVTESNGEVFKFKITAEDWQGQIHHFELPLFWVRRNVAEQNDDPAWQSAAQEYDLQSDRRNAQMSGQKIAYSPTRESPQKGVTNPDGSVITKTIKWTIIDKVGLPSPKKFPNEWYIRFFPNIFDAAVQLDSAAAFSTSAPTNARLTFDKTYELAGFDGLKNSAEVFARIENASMDFDGAKSGGLCTPSIDIRRLSRVFGPMGPASTPVGGAAAGGAAALNAGVKVRFEAKDFFKGAANLIGGVGLKDVVATVEDVAQEVDRVPRLVAKHLEGWVQNLQGLERSVNVVRGLLGILSDSSVDKAVSRIRLHLQQEIRGCRQTLQSVGTGIQALLADTAVDVQHVILTEEDVAKRIYAQTLANLKLGELVGQEAAPRLEALLQLAIRDSDVLSQLQVYWDDPGTVKIEIRRKLNQLLGPELRKLGKTEAAVTDIINHVMSQASGAVDQSVGLLLRSVPRLREWAVAQLKIYTPVPLSADERLKLATDIIALRKQFDAVVIFRQISRFLTAIQETVEQLSKFPLLQFRELQNSLERIVSDVADPLNRARDLTAALAELRRKIYELAAATGVAADRAVAFKPADLFKSEHDSIQEIANSVRSQLAKLSEQVSEPVKNWRDAIVSGLAGINSNARTKIQSAVDTYLDVTTGALVKQVNLEFAKLDKTAKDFLGSIEQIAGPFLSDLSTASRAIADTINQTADGIDQIIAQAEKLESQLPKDINLEYDWHPRVQDASIFIANCDGRPATFSLNAKIHKSLNPSDITRPPSVRIEGRLENFQLRLIPSAPFILVKFSQLTFLSIDGAKPDVKVDILKVDFDQALGFVKDLAKALSSNSGFFIQLAGLGLEAGYRFGIPAITTGGFSLTQVAIVTTLSLPFNGDPVRVRFSLSERHRPFLLSVGILGGGGFFGITLSSRGVECIEGSLEFGAVLTLDIGVASGRVSVTAGIYFSLAGEDASLYGFVRASGALDILGLITLTVEFYLGVGYERRGGKTYAVGEAIVHVEIEFAFFSIGVDLHYRKEFEGSSSAGGGQLQGNSESQLAGGAARPLDHHAPIGENHAPVDEALCNQFSRFAAGWGSYREFFTSNSNN